MAEDDKYLKRIEASMRLDIDLYRGGNAVSPRFDNVRDRDIVKFKKPSGDEMVKGLSGGISTFTAPRAERNWWWLRAGTVAYRHHALHHSSKFRHAFVGVHCKDGRVHWRDET